jgi:signal recognition particle subunit SEC65
VAKVARKEEMRKCVQELCLKTTGKRTPRNPKHRWEGNIEVDIKGRGLKGVV